MEVELVESFLVPVRLYDDSWESAHEVKCKFANFLLRFLRARADLTEAKSIGGGARARRVVNCIVLFFTSTAAAHFLASYVYSKLHQRAFKNHKYFIGKGALL